MFYWLSYWSFQLLHTITWVYISVYISVSHTECYNNLYISVYPSVSHTECYNNLYISLYISVSHTECYNSLYISVYPSVSHTNQCRVWRGTLSSLAPPCCREWSGPRWESGWWLTSAVAWRKTWTVARYRPQTANSANSKQHTGEILTILGNMAKNNKYLQNISSIND